MEASLGLNGTTGANSLQGRSSGATKSRCGTGFGSGSQALECRCVFLLRAVIRPPLFEEGGSMHLWER